MTDPLVLLDQYFDGTLTEEGTEELRAYIKSDPQNAREIMLAASMHSNLGELLSGMGELRDGGIQKVPQAGPLAKLQRVSFDSAAESRTPFWRTSLIRYTAIAALFFLVVFVGLTLLRSHPPGNSKNQIAADDVDAVLSSAINPVWESSATAARLGQRLPQGTLKLRSGLVRVTMPSATVVVVEGPAEFMVNSSNEIQLKHGSLTSLVSPQGIGFTVATPDGTVTDLGTEFGVYVDRNQQTHAEVFSGKVRVSVAGGGKESWILKAGRAVQITSGEATLQDASPEPLAFVRPAQFAEIQNAGGDQGFARWTSFSRNLRQDESAVAYYAFDKQNAQPVRLLNAARATQGIFDGAIDGAAWDQGRFPGKQALRFTGGNAAVHLNISQPLPALTMAAWMNAENFNVASAETKGNRFNALLLSDGVHESAIHWQIMDGRRLELGLSLGNNNEIVGSPTTFKHYWSSDVLTPSSVTRWVFVAVVVDPVSREVRHYCDNEIVGVSPLGNHPVPLIGLAEIGNWEPRGARADAARGFVGRIDELAIIGRPLSDQEIAAMYAAGSGQ